MQTSARLRWRWSDGAEEVTTFEEFAKAMANIRSLYRLVQDGVIREATVTIELEATADAHG